ncbi:MAG: NUDIX hydrolase YfcD [Desulfobulbus sp.]|nr:MAG: NUDIX hydrolase YfcD [Desulfobulbus sp.]RUM41823.1 MAG: NUDIX hydrolase YfcD [Desulfobulbus sp.]
MYNPDEELVQIVDEDDQEIAVVTRQIMREQRLIHRASYILVFNKKGELFVQKRTTTKDIYPGYWDVAAGGVVLGGESYEQSAERELAEELGVTGVKLTPLFDQYYEDEGNRVWGRIFRCESEGPFTLQPEEVEYGRFMPPDLALEYSIIEPFTPDGVVLLKKVIQARDN